MGNGGKLRGVSVVVVELASALSPRRAKAFALGFALAFVACTAFLALGTPAGTAAPWLAGIFNSSSAVSPAAYAAPYQARLSSLLFHFFPNSSTFSGTPLPVLENGAAGSPGNAVPGKNQTGVVMSSPRSGVGLQGNAASGKNRTEKKAAFPVSGLTGKNQTTVGVGLEKNGDKKQMGSGIGLQSNESPARNDTRNKVGSLGSRVTGNGVPGNRQKETRAGSQANGVNAGKNQTGKGVSSKENGVPARTLNETKADLQGNGVQSQTQGNSVQASSVQERNQTGLKQAKVSNLTASLMKRGSPALPRASNSESDDKKSKGLIKSLMECDIYHGRWVKDESYPLYLEGSCPHIDEPFNCYLNGRPDRNYQKLRWQPHGCSIPRLNATDMLERLRGRRVVFVGDSLNRNMWESLVCILRNSLKDKSKVLEASGRHEFRTEGSYSFLFKDYNCTVEFFRSPFLVQEWEMPGSNGTKKETLRLDIIEGSSSNYKDAHVIVFNTGHWWTHEKTSKGKDYYQEGNHVYGELNVVDAFHKALNTWAKWVDNNVNPKKTLVFFRGYSASHFSGGQWNSGGACDKETEPIKNEAYLSPYPPKMRVLETVIKGMKVPVSYLNITRMTDYRKDAHPSIYRKQNLSEEERRSPERYQDCSHWCLPGVPDLWNELLYAQLIIKQHQLQQVKA